MVAKKQRRFRLAFAGWGLAGVAMMALGWVAWGGARDVRAATGNGLFHSASAKGTKAASGSDVAPMIQRVQKAIVAITYKRNPSSRTNKRWKRRFRQPFGRFRRRFRQRYRKWGSRPSRPSRRSQGGEDDLFKFFDDGPGSKLPKDEPRRKSIRKRLRGFMRRALSTRQGSVSGILIHASGYVITRHRGVANAKSLKIHVSSGKVYDAKVIGKADWLGLVLLQIKTKDKVIFPFLPLGDVSKVPVGSSVVVLGRGAKDGLYATKGLLSNKGFTRRGPVLRTDARVYRGQRGGALLNLEGHVIGLLRRGSMRGGVALSADLIKRALPQLKQKGSIQKAKLGVKISPIKAGLLKVMKLQSTKGALVATVMAGSPAAKAGIKPGDVIVRFDGQDIAAVAVLPTVVALTSTAAPVDVDVLRDGKKLTIKVDLKAWKKDKKPAVDKPTTKPAKKKAASGQDSLTRFGVSVRSLSKDRAQDLKLKAGMVEISAVERGKPAAENGLRAGDVIVEVNRTKITSIQSFLAVTGKVGKDENVLLLVRRGGSALFVAFTLP